MNILIDMNLSPRWCAVLQEGGHNAVHWSSVGEPTAPDQEVMNWASREGYVVFTHDLDFGAILAITNAVAPSVIQMRNQGVLPLQIGKTVLSALREFEAELDSGALIIIDETQSRVRILPLR